MVDEGRCGVREGSKPVGPLLPGVWGKEMTSSRRSLYPVDRQIAHLGTIQEFIRFRNDVFDIQITVEF